MRITHDIKGDIDFKDSIAEKIESQNQAAKVANIRTAMEYAKNVSTAVEFRHYIKHRSFYRYRVTKRIRESDGQTRIIFKYNPIKAMHLSGVIKQDDSGSWVGRHFFPYAFIAKMPNGDVSIFKRYRKSVIKSPNAWWNNLPIKEQTIVLGIDDIVEFEAAKTQSNFKKFYALELQKRLKK